MHPEDIKAELKKSKSSMAAVGRALNVSTQAVAQAIEGKHRSRRIEAEVARRLELPIEALWPNHHPVKAA